MILISHRGNISGKNVSLENNPNYIKDAIYLGYNVEVDVCPVFNQAIEDKKEIRTFNIEKMWGLGTPEDLKYYLENYK